MAHPAANRSIILVVDDNPTNLGVLLDYLGANGFRVLVAEDGESALERARFGNPDIILLDVMMPGMDGFETCRRLAADPLTHDIPVIFMTALTSIADKVACFQAGGVDFVAKPFQQEEILARLTAHCRLRTLQADLALRNEELEHEIAQRKRSEAALAESVAELRTRNAELDTFTRAVAHDLSNDLEKLIASAAVVKEDGKLEGEFAEYLEVIHQTGQHMTRTFKGLLLLAQLRQARVTTRPVDMSESITWACRRLAPLIDGSRAEIVQPASLPRAMAYAPWIEEVWFNYLGNAIKYGGRPPHIEMGADACTDGWIRYWVRDDGQGLTLDEQNLLFSREVHLDHARVRGSGLGLSIVKHIIEKLGGKVGVDSQVGRGSTFYFELTEA